MTRPLKDSIAISLIFLAAASSILLYPLQGVSFFTFHALSGLMALKHQTAQCFLSGAYPLWNPFILNGVPFHSGIGIADPFLFSYLFTSGIQSLLLSVVLALAVAGIGMYLYLSRERKLSHEASFFGGFLYALNPFFGATCHETPFMNSPVFLPWIFLFYETGIRRRKQMPVVAAGVMMGLTFLSGNLESFYFVGLFFAGIRFFMAFILSSEGSVLGNLRREFAALVVCFASAFFFAAVDLLPTFRMMADSGRNANTVILHNTLFIFLTGILTLAVYWGWRWVTRKNKEQFVQTALVLLFGLYAVRWAGAHESLQWDRNIFMPVLSQLMVHGRDAFDILRTVVPAHEQLLKPLVEPRFIFYIQPPLYLFSFVTLWLFCFFIRKPTDSKILFLAFWAVVMSLFPFTSVPNIFARLFQLDQIAYPRVMFGFFFLQSIVVAESIHQAVIRRTEKAEPQKGVKHPVLLLLATIPALLWLIAVIGPLPGEKFVEVLKGFSSQGFLSAVWTRLLLTLQGLHFLYGQSLLAALTGTFQVLSGFMLWMFIERTSRSWLVAFIASVFIATLLSWNAYVFQKPDIQSLHHHFPETKLLEEIKNTDERIAVRSSRSIDVFNFYDVPQPFLLADNMPLFWDVRTIEGATLNLSPKRFNQYWALESKNEYTPTVLVEPASLIYDEMGMNYILSDESLEIAQYELLFRGLRFWVYKNEAARDRFYFPEAVLKGNYDEFRSNIQSGINRPKKTIVAAVPDDLSFEPQKKSVEILEDGYNRLVLRTETEAPAFLATTDAFHKNWKSFIDGHEVPVYETQYYFRGLEVPKGVHEIQFRYVSLEHRMGFILTSLFMLYLLGAGIFHRKRRTV